MSLYIYHEGTGTLISLDDKVFLINDKYCDEDTLDSMENGASVSEFEHKGYRIDNYNMTNLFFGGN